MNENRLQNRNVFMRCLSRHPPPTLFDQSTCCESLSTIAMSSSVFLEYVAAVNNLTDLASKTGPKAERYWDKTKKGPANAGPSKESSIRP